MRQKPLTGYCIHSRPYRDKRAIYRFFCQNNGMVDGVARQGLLLFVPLTAFATGKSALKNFSQCQYSTLTPTTFLGVSYYGALYINELLYRLLPLEDAMPILFTEYVQALAELQILARTDELGLRQILRRFERTLLSELGAQIDFTQDSFARAIEPDAYYRFAMGAGFEKVALLTDEPQTLSGADILYLASHYFTPELLTDPRRLSTITALHRLVLDGLLEYKPLHSRQLWRDKVSFQLSS